MDANLKAMWVEALRSGEYKQGNGYLEKNGLHCCLGVLCAIQDSEWKRYWQDDAMEEEALYTEKLPPKLSASLTPTTCRHLANMNDDGSPFAEIADYIEANL